MLLHLFGTVCRRQYGNQRHSSLPIFRSKGWSLNFLPTLKVSRNSRLCIRKQATLLPFSPTKSPVSGYKVYCFGNKCGQAFSAVLSERLIALLRDLTVTRVFAVICHFKVNSSIKSNEAPFVRQANVLETYIMLAYVRNTSLHWYTVVCRPTGRLAVENVSRPSQR